MKITIYIARSLFVLFLGIIFPINLLSQVTPWVEQTYEGNDLIDVKCGSDVLIAADLPFVDKSPQFK